MFALVIAACCSFMLANGQSNCPDRIETQTVATARSLRNVYGLDAFQNAMDL